MRLSTISQHSTAYMEISSAICFPYRGELDLRAVSDHFPFQACPHASVLAAPSGATND
jgi:hypothetical protein